MYEVMNGFYMRRLSQRALFDFRTTFYTDPDPRIEALRGIKCPTLILAGEHDVVFVPASRIMAAEIPDNKLVIMPGVGHMTAIEAPDETAREILGFLNMVKEKGKTK
jgi:pimeloyl-ACP methyl ester carboxylesterase